MCGPTKLRSRRNVVTSYQTPHTESQTGTFGDTSSAYKNSGMEHSPQATELSQFHNRHSVATFRTITRPKRHDIGGGLQIFP